MINKDRVRTMTRLAIYEEGQGVADDKMNARKDRASRTTR